MTAIGSAAVFIMLQLSVAAPQWSEQETKVLASLRITSSHVPATEFSNRFSDNQTASTLGKLLFFDSRLSINGKISCASCHKPDRYYTDGLERAKGIAGTIRNTPSIVNAAYNSWFYWDGRKDSLWSQALNPLEAADEMGGSRMAVARLIGTDSRYLALYEDLFGEYPDRLLSAELPTHAGPLGTSDMRDNWRSLAPDVQVSVNQVYVNAGKSIAAFERTLLSTPNRFDNYVAQLLSIQDGKEDPILSADEIQGAKLFIDGNKTQCLQCHNGPMLSNDGFHNIGTGNFDGDHLDFGRVFGLRAVLMDEFNCIGPFSDADPDQCLELRFLNRDSHIPLEGAYKVPSLRNLLQSAPYFHDGRYATLREVVDYYNNPPTFEVVGVHELRPLGLSPEETSQLVKFLEALSKD